jgi:hypothetical protein
MEEEMIDMMEELTEDPQDQKVVKCILLKNNEWLITEIEELRVDYELNLPNCKLTNPYQIDFLYDYENKPTKIEWSDRPTVRIGCTEETKKYEIYPWNETVTDDAEVLLFSEFIVTIVEPKPAILEAYLHATE